MNKFFKENILDVGILVHGETDDYVVTLSFGGLLDQIHEELVRNTEAKFDARTVLRALIRTFNSDDVYIRCSCGDWQYRMAYFASVNDIMAGLPKEGRPSKITNPNDELGPCCKHVALVLNNTSFLTKIASVIVNYSHYMESHYNNVYQKIIFPAVYGEDVIYDDELRSDARLIDLANKYGATRGQFKKGNIEGVRFAKEDATEAQEASKSTLNIDATNFDVKDYSN